MIHRLIPAIFMIVLVMAAPHGTKAQQPVLVSPRWLHDHLGDPKIVILHTGFLIRSDYEREHIEGARFLWSDWLAFNSPDANMNAPDAKSATRLLQELGINRDSKIVICHKGTDVTIAARIFLTFEHLGFEGQTSFLNGGLEAWKKAGFPVVNKPAVFSKGNSAAKLQSKFVDKQYVLNALQTQAATVVDARAKRFYDGDVTGNPRDGHITGALNLPFPDMLDSLNQFKTREQIQKYFDAALPGNQKEVIVYCFVGQTASVDYLAGRILGYRMKLYDGSIQEWSRDPSLPMEKSR